MGSTGIHEHYKLVHSFWHGHACLHKAFTQIPIRIKLIRVRVSAPIQIASRDYDLKSACKRFSHYTNETRRAYYYFYFHTKSETHLHVAWITNKLSILGFFLGSRSYGYQTLSQQQAIIDLYLRDSQACRTVVWSVMDHSVHRDRSQRNFFLASLAMWLTLGT